MLCESDLFFAQRFAVSGCRVLPVRCAISDMTIQHDECGPVLCFSESGERLFDTIYIVGISDSQHVPSIREEASRYILSECYTRVSFDRDVVVVVDPAKVVEAQMSGERCRFRCNALHQTAITTNCVDVVVEDIETWFIEAVGEPLLSDRHADAGGYTLAQWTSCGFNARYPVVLGMARRLAVELAEPSDVIECY